MSATLPVAGVITTADHWSLWTTPGEVLRAVDEPAQAAEVEPEALVDADEELFAEPLLEPLLEPPLEELPFDAALDPAESEPVLVELDDVSPLLAAVSLELVPAGVELLLAPLRESVR